MNEASVSTTFMQKLRQRLPQAVVFKHADAGLKGLPDCSVTYKGLTLWLEFKLLDSVSEAEDMVSAIKKRLEKAPVQLRCVQALNRAGYALYIVWIRASKIVVFYNPVTESIVGSAGNNDGACQWVESYLESANPPQVIRLL